MGDGQFLHGECPEQASIWALAVESREMGVPGLGLGGAAFWCKEC